MSYQEINQDNSNQKNPKESENKKVVIQGPDIKNPNQMKNWPTTLNDSPKNFDKEKQLAPNMVSIAS